jgi:hypothetical protein
MGRWSTVHTERTVLAVTRNVVSTHRLLDALAIFESDRRIRILFTIAEKQGELSRFVGGTNELLQRAQAEVISWREALEHTFDLALSASYQGDLTELPTPLMVLPHGAGHNKFLPDGTVAGMSPELLLHNGNPVAAAIVLSGEEQYERLRDSCPQVLHLATIAGDPCFDRLMVSRDLREDYRRELGIRQDQVFILLSSTWRGNSLLATWTDLPADLIGVLPADEFRLAISVHPNVWAYHSGLSVDSWLADARRAGLLVLPPDGSWRAALAAADLVIGDHGSVSLYAAAMGIPLLAGVRSSPETVPGSAAAELMTVAERLNPALPLRPQVTGFAEDYSEVLAKMISARGEALPRLRELTYRLLGLELPSRSPITPAVPPVERRGVRVKTFRVTARAYEDKAEVERFPAILSGPDGLLLSQEDEEHPPFRHNASILIGPSSDLLDRYPGCFLAATPIPGGVLIRSRDGAVYQLLGEAPPAVLASAAYVHPDPLWVRTGSHYVAVKKVPQDS